MSNPIRINRGFYPPDPLRSVAPQELESHAVKEKVVEHRCTFKSVAAGTVKGMWSHTDYFVDLWEELTCRTCLHYNVAKLVFGCL